MESKKCCLCEKSYVGYGNNAVPLAEGKCCDNCNNKVIAERMRVYYEKEKEEEKEKEKEEKLRKKIEKYNEHVKNNPEDGWFWNHEYRHFLRGATEPQRGEVHKKFLEANLPTDGESAEHLSIISQVFKIEADDLPGYFLGVRPGE